MKRCGVYPRHSIYEADNIRDEVNYFTTCQLTSRFDPCPPFRQLIQAIPYSNRRPTTDHSLQCLDRRRVAHNATHLCARQLDRDHSHVSKSLTVAKNHWQLFVSCDAFPVCNLVAFERWD
jgi:hypothetical protein